MDDLKTDITVRLAPRSSRNQILGRDGDIFRIKVTAPPVDGKANKALIELLAGRLGIAKGRIRVVSGQTSRVKLIRIEGLSFEEIEERIGR